MTELRPEPQRTDKVDYWRNSNQTQRWVATALLDIEPRLNRINGYRYLPELRLGHTKGSWDKGKGSDSCVMKWSLCRE